MWPGRARDLFRQGILSADQGWLMVVIVGEADYVTRLAIFAGGLEGLRACAGWDRGRTATRQHVSNCLRGLREVGEIAYELGQGQREPLVVTVEQDDYFQATSNGPPTKTASALEVTSNGAKSGKGSIPHEQPDSDGLELPTLEVAGARLDTDADSDPRANALVRQRREGERQQLEEVFNRELGRAETHSEFGRRGRVVKELADVGATAGDVERAICAYRFQWPGNPLTDLAIARNWSLLKATPAPEYDGDYDEYVVEADDLIEEGEYAIPDNEIHAGLGDDWWLRPLEGGRE
jgi:hypothetical protein